MDSQYEEQFVVYVRDHRPQASGAAGPVPEGQELVGCATYEEAQWVRHECESRRRRCIIRYVGPSGGGD
jgi:hypothetical protein